MKIDDIASEKYRKVLRASHASVKGWGGGGKSHAETIMAWATELGAKDVLDYGCGRSTLKPSIPLPCAEFDPGIPGKDDMPEPADLVVATDVLEHVEPALVDSVIEHIHTLARKGVFLVIALTPAKFVLTDGRNAHLSLLRAETWTQLLKDQGFIIERAERRKGLWVWARKKGS